MNEERDQFEQKLSRQPIKPIPGQWRAEILAAARATQANRHSSFACRAEVQRRQIIHHSWLSTLLWPHPKAWAGLAAAWTVIFILHFSMRETAPVLAVKPLPPSPEVVAELRQQHRLYVELMGLTETRDAGRQRGAAPKPRSERGEIFRA